jgi:phage terminase large subunit
MIELRFSLQPKQRVFSEKIEQFPVCFYGGAKGGGKSKGLRLIMLMRRLKYNGSHGAIFRRTYPELEGNHIRPLFEEYPELREYWNDTKKILSLPNGSSLQFCHCMNENDVDLYQGREFHDLAIDEAGQWTEAMFRKLLGSNRSSKEGIRARAVLTGNPGGVGHTWLKRIFIERRFNDRERASDYTFIQALVDDNPALLENDPDYVHRLNSEPNEVLRKAYRYGDWDIFAGQFFSEIRREIHLIPRFDIPAHWNRFGAYDFGFNHPAAFGWFAVDEDGNVFLYREFVRAGLRIDQFAQKLKGFDETINLNPIVAGRDAWAQKGVLNKGSVNTIAEEFQEHGISLVPAAIDRVQGAAQVRSYLALRESLDGTKRPRFFIFDTCPLSFDALTRMQHDPDRVEDVLKVDAADGDPNSGDDAYDMVRYGLMSRPMITEKPKERLVVGSSRWAKAQTDRMEESINEQAQKQLAEERENDMFNIAGSDDDPLKYFLDKKRAG